MPDFQRPDVKALVAALGNTQLDFPSSDKGRFFNHTWYPMHFREIEEPVLKAIAREDDPSFDRRVNILRIIEQVDAKNGGQLKAMNFTPTEITRYGTRAINRRMASIAKGADQYYVIRNQKLTLLKLEHKAA